MKNINERSSVSIFKRKKLKVLGLFIVALFLECSFLQAQWKQQNSGIIYDFHGVYALDSAHVWTVGGNIDTAFIYHTEDGGQNWQDRYEGPAFSFSNVHFVNRTNGWVVGDTVVMHTTDTGNTWSRQSTDTTVTFNDVRFATATTGWIIGDAGIILHTIDAGMNWNKQSSGATGPLLSIHSISASKAWVSGLCGLILPTTDGGASWDYIYAASLCRTLRDVHFVNDNQGWAVGENGTVLYSSDGGNSWSIRDTSIKWDLYSVYFTDTSNGWCVGGAFDTSVIYHTENGGKDWHLQYLKNTGPLNDIQFIDSSEGWAVGAQGLIVHTSNAGGDTVINRRTASLSKKSTATIYPNPTQGEVTVQFTEVKEQVTLTIWNTNGQQVYRDEKSRTQQLSADWEGSPGIYVIEVRTSAGMHISKRIFRTNR